MRIQELFTVPEGKKVTEKIFGKVLLSSVCGILLCMACLVSTTWAWFAISVDNKDNEIQIASVTAEITVQNALDSSVVAPNAEDGSYLLDAGTYNLAIDLENTATGPDDLNRQPGDVYVAMTVTHGTESASYYFTFAGNGEGTKQLNGLQIGSGTATVSFAVSWIAPASATPVGSDAIVIGQLPAEPTTEATTAPTTVPTTEATTAPTTEPATEATTTPTTEPETTTAPAETTGETE